MQQRQGNVHSHAAAAGARCGCTVEQRSEYSGVKVTSGCSEAELVEWCLCFLIARYWMQCAACVRAGRWCNAVQVGGQAGEKRHYTTSSTRTHLVGGLQTAWVGWLIDWSADCRVAERVHWMIEVVRPPQAREQRSGRGGGADWDGRGAS